MRVLITPAFLLAASLMQIPQAYAAEQSVMVERNLFSADRKAPVRGEASEARPQGETRAMFQLDAVIINTGQRRALVSYIFQDAKRGPGDPVRRQWVRRNERLETGHVVGDIEESRVRLSRGNETVELLLHDEKRLAPPAQKLPQPTSSNKSPKPAPNK